MAFAEIINPLKTIYWYRQVTSLDQSTKFQVYDDDAFGERMLNNDFSFNMDKS